MSSDGHTGRPLVRVVAVGPRWALLLLRSGDLLETYEDKDWADNAARLINGGEWREAEGQAA